MVIKFVVVGRSTVPIGAEGVALRHQILLLMTHDTKDAESLSAELSDRSTCAAKAKRKNLSQIDKHGRTNLTGGCMTIEERIKQIEERLEKGCYDDPECVQYLTPSDDIIFLLSELKRSRGTLEYYDVHDVWCRSKRGLGKCDCVGRFAAQVLHPEGVK